MKKALLIGLTVLLGTAVPLWAGEEKSSENPQSSQSDYTYPTEEMGPGMMGSGSGYHGRGPGMRGYHHGMYRGKGGYGYHMNPDWRGWQEMTPEEREAWRQMRAKFLADTLPLRQELSAKRMELETLWDQQDPDPEKVKALSKRVTELHSQLVQKHDELLTQCRQKFGDRGWACPGGGWMRY